MKVKPTKTSGEVVLEIKSGDEPMLKAAATASFRIRRILVPIDFSDCSKKALSYAIPFAKQHNATLTLLYVAPSLSYGPGEYGVIDEATLEENLKTSGRKELERLAADHVRGEVGADTVVRTGTASDEIVELAKALPADLVVLSTHGHTGLKHVLLGSVAEHVVRNAPCPVLVVRENEHEFLAP